MLLLNGAMTTRPGNKYTGANVYPDRIHATIGSSCIRNIQKCMTSLHGEVAYLIVINGLEFGDSCAQLVQSCMLSVQIVTKGYDNKQTLHC